MMQRHSLIQIAPFCMWYIILGLIGIHLVNANRMHSASRSNNVHWENARSMHCDALCQDSLKSGNNSDINAFDYRVPFLMANFSTVPQASLKQIQELFDRARDIRFMRDGDHNNFSRRTTWLYPDDGCYARAGLLIQHAIDWNFIVPSKIFAFGNLAVNTSNSPTGYVSWWYHVVPIIRTEDSKLWVLDPSIQPDAPILVDDWISAMSKDKNSIEVSACSSFTYAPYNSCFHANQTDNTAALQDDIEYLDAEWDRQISLHRDPIRVLGDFPPWKNSSIV
jgi:hypothetical protein